MKSEDFYTLRTPKLNLGHFEKFSNFTVDDEKIIEYIGTIPGLLESIYLASPSFYERLISFDKIVEPKAKRKLIISLHKYLIRISTRPTPFGLFSGLESISIETGKSRIEVGKRVTRLDRGYIHDVNNYLASKINEFDKITVKLNDTISKNDLEYRYIEGKSKSGYVLYKLSSIENDKAIRAVCSILKKPLKFCELVKRLSETFLEENYDDIREYARACLEENLIFASIDYPLTDLHPLSTYVEELRKAEVFPFYEVFSKVEKQLAALDRNFINSIDAYKLIINYLKELPVEINENKLFQVDWYKKNAECNLNRGEIDKLVRDIEELLSVATSEKTIFTNFVRKFNQRFEGQFVPILELLDDESGISFSNDTGYDQSMIDGIIGLSSSHDSNFKLSLWDKMLIKKLIDSSGEDVINLTKKDILSISKKEVKSAFSNLLNFSLYKDENSQSVFELHGIVQPNAAGMLGRFCHLDHTLLKNVRSHIREEEEANPDLIFAEVIHQPQGRLGNIIARPKLRDFEIPIVSSAKSDPQFSLPLSDLYVFVEGELVKIWSKKHNKQVIPRISCAHNYSSNGLSIYKFLCMLQHQEHNSITFEWSTILDSARFLPRVMYKNITLIKKKWNIQRKKIEELLSGDKLSSEKLENLMLENNLDRYVVFSDYDNNLIIDLYKVTHLYVLLDVTRKQEMVHLSESLSTRYSSIPTQDSYSTGHEILLPCKSEKKLANNAKAISKPDKDFFNSFVRNFIPGSEWLSIKLYGGNSELELFLIKELNEILTLYLGSEGVSKFFFIRYADPDYHLRIRFMGKQKALYNQVLPAITEKVERLIRVQKLQRMELSTYQRELERYGGNDNICLAEDIFQSDSVNVINIISKLYENGLDNDFNRTRVGVYIVDNMLSSLNYSIEEKLALMTVLRRGYGYEFNENKYTRKRFGYIFKKIEEKIELDLTPGKAGDTFSIVMASSHYGSSSCLPSFLERISDSNSVLLSLIHMSMNRLFKAYGREYEYLVSDILRRLYQKKMYVNGG